MCEVHLNAGREPLKKKCPEEGGVLLSWRTQLEEVCQQLQWPPRTQVR
jgi:hypothetical protein